MRISPVTTPLRAPLRRLAHLALPVEQTILPHTSPPFHVQIEQLDWQPDPFDTYCDRCGVHIGPHELDDRGCAHCRGSRFPWDQFLRLASYEPPLVDWIHQVKFTRYVTLAHQLGALLGRRLLDAGLDPQRTVLTPMPTTWRRRVARGIDHAGEIASGAAHVLDSPVVRYLDRAHRPSQRAVSPSGRTGNVAQAFHLRASHGAGALTALRRARPHAVGGAHAALSLSGWDLVLVDDVCTTGATLRAAARELSRLKPDMLLVAVLAVSDDEARKARRAR